MAVFFKHERLTKKWNPDDDDDEDDVDIEDDDDEA